jgi:DNA polymerase-3 subunit beta
MKIKILNKELAKSLSNVGNVISNKTIEPILQNVLLKTDNGKAELIGTNLEQGIKVKLNGEIIREENENISVVLPYSLLKDIVAKLNMDEYTMINIGTKSGSIKQNEANYKMNFLDAESFAILPDIEEKIKFDIEIKVLKDLINDTLFAVSKREESRKEFRGIYFESGEGKIKFVGTDSTVLAISEMPITDMPEISFIIPWKAMDILNRMDINSDKVSVISNGSQIAFNSNDISIISLLINGTFPPYENAIPKVSEFKVEINKNKLLSALSRLEILAKRGNEKINLKFSNGILEAQANSQESGEGKEKIEFNGSAELSLLFYGERLLEGVSHIKGDTVVMEMNGPLHPVKITGKGNNSFLFIIMPQRP